MGLFVLLNCIVKEPRYLSASWPIETPVWLLAGQQNIKSRNLDAEAKYRTLKGFIKESVNPEIPKLRLD